MTMSILMGGTRARPARDDPRGGGSIMYGRT